MCTKILYVYLFVGHFFSSRCRTASQWFYRHPVRCHGNSLQQSTQISKSVEIQITAHGVQCCNHRIYCISLLWFDFLDYVDKSGFRIYYTPTKRRYDGGLLLFGHSLSPYGVELVLPPGMKDVVMENVCPRDCTQAVIYTVHEWI